MPKSKKIIAIYCWTCVHLWYEKLINITITNNIKHCIWWNETLYWECNFSLKFLQVNFVQQVWLDFCDISHELVCLSHIDTILNAIIKSFLTFSHYILIASIHISSILLLMHDLQNYSTTVELQNVFVRTDAPSTFWLLTCFCANQSLKKAKKYSRWYHLILLVM